MDASNVLLVNLNVSLYERSSCQVEVGDAMKTVKRGLQLITNKEVWINPNKKLQQMDYRDLQENITGEIEASLSKGIRLILLAGFPGIGKSTELQAVENYLRRNIKRHRIIVKVCLSEEQEKLFKTPKDAEEALKMLCPYIHSNYPDYNTNDDFNTYVLLDSLDKVHPFFFKSTVTLIETFLAHEKFCIIASTRTHLVSVLKERIKSRIKVVSFGSIQNFQQNRYLRDKLNCSQKEVVSIRNCFQKSVNDCFNNIEMLEILAEQLSKIIKYQGQSHEINVYHLYTRLVESKHNNYLLKNNLDPRYNFSRVSNESLFLRNLPVYYYIAVQELASKKLASQEPEFPDNSSLPLLCSCAYLKLSKQPPTDVVLVSEMLNPGLLVRQEVKHSRNKLNVNSTQEFRFKHRSLAEYFYARLLLEADETFDNEVGEADETVTNEVDDEADDIEVDDEAAEADDIEVDHEADKRRCTNSNSKLCPKYNLHPNSIDSVTRFYISRL